MEMNVFQFSDLIGLTGKQVKGTWNEVPGNLGSRFGSLTCSDCRQVKKWLNYLRIHRAVLMSNRQRTLQHYQIAMEIQDSGYFLTVVLLVTVKSSCADRWAS